MQLEVVRYADLPVHAAAGSLEKLHFNFLERKRSLTCDKSLGAMKSVILNRKDDYICFWTRRVSSSVWVSFERVCGVCRNLYTLGFGGGTEDVFCVKVRKASYMGTPYRNTRVLVGTVKEWC